MHLWFKNRRLEIICDAAVYMDSTVGLAGEGCVDEGASLRADHGSHREDVRRCRGESTQGVVECRRVSVRVREVKLGQVHC